MQKNIDDRSGLPLLTVYTVLVFAAVAISIGAFFALQEIVPDFAELAFTILLLSSIVVTWPLAVWLEEAFLVPRSNAMGAQKRAS